MYLDFIDFDLEIFLKLNLGTVDNSEDEKVHSLTERSLTQLLGNANLKYLQLWILNSGRSITDTIK